MNWLKYIFHTPVIILLLSGITYGQQEMRYDFGSVPLTKLSAHSAKDVIYHRHQHRDPNGFPAYLLNIPPLNDNCSATQNMVNPNTCLTGSLGSATIEPGEYTGSPCLSKRSTESVWYSFSATAPEMYVQVLYLSLVSGSVWCPWRFATAIFEDSGCQPGSAQFLDCDNSGDDGIIVSNLTGLIPGNNYLVQVSYDNSDGCSEPDFCVSFGETIECESCNDPCGNMCIFPSQPTVSDIIINCDGYDFNPRLEGSSIETLCFEFNATTITMEFDVFINSNCPPSQQFDNFSWDLYLKSDCSVVIQSGDDVDNILVGLGTGVDYVLCYTLVVPPFCHHIKHFPYLIENPPLPVEMISFTGKQFQNGIILNWVTGSETNNDYFIVMRSENGKEFIAKGKVKGAGNSSQAKKYKFTDIPLNVGTYYYRLKQVDFDGSFYFSDVIKLDFSFEKEQVIDVNPNPVRNEIRVLFRSSMEGTFHLNLLDSSGRLLQSDDIEHDGNVTEWKTGVENLDAGIYILRINSSTETDVRRIIKVKY